MFDILYQNSNFLVINKHPNVSVHKDDGETSLLIELAKETGDKQLYLIHRLDKMTSGLLLIGRNQAAASELSQLFANRLVEKYYLAIGDKKPKKKQGLVIGDMERSRRASWKLINSKENPAVTQFFSTAAQGGNRLFLCKPHTGKTHQIRVALKSVGSGILGDPIYSSSNADRGYLHAYALRFTYQTQNFEFVELPKQGEEWENETVQAGLQQWQMPWTLTWPEIKKK
ncbi:TIGR01621 family pseudouridine synthase [Aliivibrio fischeri]|uniref:Pseudouridine synthase Rlu family protein n=1 Tax=Aliivibrio fischeri (strain MJ11) TaxID=388396 RepID=B5FDA9_ALIFM|nr:TIGR01621 family pseudouridine synthase [Aliivibrio fischeri]ACH67251.1 pseudouridine synthase Rlu family protein [Aliivibrio fischeri MJ11]OCH30512.1 RNA pseudouridine synthase [Aliivibrio fischeri]OCH39157.1 RNA pseudouridine synthase [Aliivibrio fischeri]OED57601.1 RNA pseudouridine synthase [Aliivibrio fischeri]USR96474.1 TIGR01621 family pseudouridine synthase [Aliivibrio fischeri ATCC 7744 = JCM 18803 = DSM 507]